MLPPWPEKAAVTGSGFGAVVIQAIVFFAAHQVEHIDRVAVANPEVLVTGTGLEQADLVARVWRQPVRKQAAGRATADDYIIKHIRRPVGQ